MPNETVTCALTLEIESANGVALVKCHGKLIAGVTDVLYKNVSKLIPDNKRIILDLTDLIHVDSMGLGTLVRLYVSCKTAGTRLELINIGKKVRDLLGMTHLLDVFTVIGESGIKMGF